MVYAHSYFSLRYGTISIERLIELLVKGGYKAALLADINNSTGILDFVKLAQENNIKPLVGIDFRNGDEHYYTGIAKNAQGFQELNAFLTSINLGEKELPKQPDYLENVRFVFPLGRKHPSKMRLNEYIGIKPSQLFELQKGEYKRYTEKLVLYNPLSFGSHIGHDLHRHLRAIENNCLLSHLKKEQIAPPDEVFQPWAKLQDKLKEYSFLLHNTETLFASCSFSFDFKTPKNKKHYTGTASDDKLLLEQLALDGMEYRYGLHNPVARKRVEHELKIIDELGFSSYFLMTWDIIRYSISKGFYHVGRGSGANSVVAYCLKITDVDPIELDLYFERFLNPKRTSPPDFDIDYSWKERDTVLEYIFKRFGKDHTALLGAMSTFKANSIMRELGKVYGLPKAEIDALAENPTAEYNRNEYTQKIFKYGNLMTDFPNLRTIHAGGVLISEAPITAYTALDLPPKGFPTSQWDMYTAEPIGFEKLDILSQRGIGHIKDAVEIIRKNRGVEIDIHDVERFKIDEKVCGQLHSGDTIGCFYIESPAMRQLLKKLHCDNYLHLVAASSIIRPGVAQSGMMKEYIQRFHNPDKIKYLHPVMEEQLKETFGIMIYQEDVIKVCHHFAGLDLSDADILRRAMSGKYRGKAEMKRITNKYFENCKALGYPDILAKEVWRQIESFSGYSFSKAHSASFAVESYQSLYLKTYFPRDFMVAVLNNFGGFYNARVYVNEAKRAGATILLPCVNTSEYLTIIQSEDIYLGFIYIQSLEEKVAKNIVAERFQHGNYQDLNNFVSRTGITLEQLILLIRVDALRFIRKSKQQLLWDAHLLLGKSSLPKPTTQLFALPQKEFQLPALIHDPVEDFYDELELLGFSVTTTEFEMLETSYRGDIQAKDLLQYAGQKVKMVGSYVTTKVTQTIRNEIMNFGCFLDVNGDFFDTVHFPPCLREYPFRGRGCYLIQGKVVDDFGFASIEVEKMAKLPFKKDPRY